MTCLAFALLGVGFMLAEMALFQKFVLYFRHPTLALTILLTVILVGTGTGSWLSHLWKPRDIMKRVQLMGLVITGILLFFRIGSVFIPLLGNSLIQPALIISLFLIGLVLGVPFPLLLRYLNAESRQDLVPYAWGINGIASVTGSVFSVIFAKWFGWSAVLVMAAGIYLALALLLQRVRIGNRRRSEYTVGRNGVVESQLAFRREEISLNR